MLPVMQSDTPGHISTFSSVDLIITLQYGYEKYAYRLFFFFEPEKF